MAVDTVIISTTQFTINGKTVYKKDGSWFSNPYLSTTEETKAARELIEQIKGGTIGVPAGEPQNLTQI